MRIRVTQNALLQRTARHHTQQCHEQEPTNYRVRSRGFFPTTDELYSRQKEAIHHTPDVVHKLKNLTIYGVFWYMKTTHIDLVRAPRRRWGKRIDRFLCQHARHVSFLP